jgi:sec-independent protein translocase protein TatA
MLTSVLNTAFDPTLAILGLPSGSELIIVLFIIILLFGNRLPGTMRSLGQSLVQFKKGMKETDEDGSSGSEKLQ